MRKNYTQIYNLQANKQAFSIVEGITCCVFVIIQDSPRKSSNFQDLSEIEKPTPLKLTWSVALLSYPSEAQV